MTNVAQVWAVPSPDIANAIEFDSGVSIKRVLAEPPNHPPISALLLQTLTASDDLSESPEPSFRRIGQVLSRLSFSLLCPLQVFSARVLAPGRKDGDEIECVLFPGTPPGIALFESKVGYNKSLRFDPTFLNGPISKEVESAISWFSIGNLAPNSVQQILCHWIGLESLAPTVSGPWQCAECRGDVVECPHCRTPTSGPKTVRSIRDYLEGRLGVSRKEYKALYELRCKISHGDLAMDPEGIDKATGKAFRIQELLLMGIKDALGWPADQPPLIQPHGFTLVGVPCLVCRTTISDADFYDKPGIYPA